MVNMKIISQSADELVLKEGGASGIAIGVALVTAGVLAGVFLRESGGTTQTRNDSYDGRPDLRQPVTHQSVREMLEAVRDQGVRRLE
jgi:hypothetical protein